SLTHFTKTAMRTSSQVLSVGSRCSGVFSPSAPWQAQCEFRETASSCHSPLDISGRHRACMPMAAATGACRLHHTHLNRHDEFRHGCHGSFRIPDQHKSDWPELHP